MLKLIIGKYGEFLAVRYLKRRGYCILKRNFKTAMGEIDIIARDGQCTVFVEVKTRQSDKYGAPFEAVNKKKLERIHNVALLYLKREPRQVSARFDVISITIDGRKKTIEHIKDVYE